MPRPVLDSLGLVVRPGEAVHISGSNGAGKTTLLRVLNGLIRPETGSVLFGELDPERDRRRFQAQAAFLPAGDRGLYARLPVERHLDLWARIDLAAPAVRRAQVSAAIARFDLAALAGRRVDRLSMGQRQRVRLAGLLLSDPRLLMLDEPQNSLDQDGVTLVAEIVDSLRAAGGVVIWCSPAGEQTAVSFDRSFTLTDGKLVSR